MVKIELDERSIEYIVSDSVYLIYGVGVTRREAVEDFFLALMDYYSLLYRDRGMGKIEEALFTRLDMDLPVISSQAIRLI